MPGPTQPALALGLGEAGPETGCNCKDTNVLGGRLCEKVRPRTFHGSQRTYRIIRSERQHDDKQQLSCACACSPASDVSMGYGMGICVWPGWGRGVGGLAGDTQQAIPKWANCGVLSRVGLDLKNSAGRDSSGLEIYRSGRRYREDIFTKNRL